MYFSGRGGGVYFEPPPPPTAAILYAPPSFIRTPPLEGYFQGWRGGCIKFGPVNSKLHYLKWCFTGFPPGGASLKVEKAHFVA